MYVFVDSIVYCDEFDIQGCVTCVMEALSLFVIMIEISKLSISFFILLIVICF